MTALSSRVHPTTATASIPIAQARGFTPPPHPLAALRSDEMAIISRVVKAYNPSKTCAFRRILLVEPPKALVVPILKAELAGTRLPPAPARLGQALFYFEGETNFMESIIDIRSQKLMSQRHLEGMHGPGDDDEVLEVAAASLRSPLVKKEIERLQLPEGCEVVAEPWPYGTDDTPVDIRLYQVWYFLNLAENKDHPSAMFYAHPLDFSAVVDIRDMSVVRVDRMPTGVDLHADTSPDKRWTPNSDGEYAPDLIPGGVRTDLKPLHISQPEGVSFTVGSDGETIKWQKWSFRVTFDVREGMVLRNVVYDGRPLFYRMALSEMTVPYGDPRSPVHRKSAYDLGECGAGQTANNLQLGCDCLGVIHYMDGLGCSAAGDPDAGLGWKHTNIRTGKAEVVRSRELVFQLIVTVGNYEYALYWIFDTAATIHYEIRAVTPVDANIDCTGLKYGTVVADGVFAPHHQHSASSRPLCRSKRLALILVLPPFPSHLTVFNLRIDPAIDGYEDSVVVYDETLPMPRDANNPHGVGFEVFSTKVEKESAFNLDWETNRVVKMVNPNSLNRYSGKPVGYKIVAPPTQLGLAHESSMHNRRGEFVNNHLHVTKHSDAELFAAGEHPWQSIGGQGGCRTWAARERPVGAGEGVVWFTLGFTHATKSEDWPIMSSEVFRMHFKPTGFFDYNPALDMPPSTQRVNNSTLADVEKPAVISKCCAGKL
ncbi:hypothetical protein RQP46_010499 [Phenoliferia psychrophenolica]